MNLLKRYSLLAIIVLAVEVAMLYLFRTPMNKLVRIPRTFEQVVFGDRIFSASVLPSLFQNAEPAKEVMSKEINSPPPHASISERNLKAAGLVNIQDLDPTIAVDLKYSTNDNFLHKNLYGDLRSCFLQEETAGKLVKAQKLLKERFPFYSLVVFDGVRPLSIQKMMWNELEVPEHLKDKYVSDPQVGSLHNYGCAVDVSIINEDGWEMDMGTSYDYFGELGHPAAEQRMVNEGKLTWRQFENRKLLRDVMTQAGFTTITTEWWHFNGSSLKIAGERYKMVD